MNNEAEKKESSTPKAQETAAPTPAPAYVVVSNDLFQGALAQAAQASELKDRLLRAQAEWDNSRKRILREKEEAVRYAGEAILERLLPVLDNFETGMQAAKTATEPINAVGQPFDPHRHEALGHHESHEHPEGHVLSQIRKGYKLKDRLLRAASVFVAKPPEGKHSKKD
jgi:molecular chaperone GrpE